MKPRRIVLGNNHKRGISTTLGLLDEALCEFESWANGRETRSALYREKNDLSPERREKILGEVAQMRDMLRELRDTLGLDGTVRSATKEIWGRCLGLWDHLAELETRYLRRYGEPPPGLAEYLDPKAVRLLELLQGISSLVKTR